jgi:hypothetical protein
MAVLGLDERAARQRDIGLTLRLVGGP